MGPVSSSRQERCPCDASDCYLRFGRASSEARMVWAMLLDPAAPLASKAFAVMARSCTWFRRWTSSATSCRCSDGSTMAWCLPAYSGSLTGFCRRNSMKRCGVAPALAGGTRSRARPSVLYDALFPLAYERHRDRHRAISLAWDYVGPLGRLACPTARDPDASNRQWRCQHEHSALRGRRCVPRGIARLDRKRHAAGGAT